MWTLSIQETEKLVEHARHPPVSELASRSSTGSIPGSGARALRGFGLEELWRERTVTRPSA
jgi:hypothetical protein